MRLLSDGWKLTPSKIISRDQFEAVLRSASRSPMAWVLIFLGGNLGLRLIEILHLRFTDFDRANGTLRVIRRKKRTLSQEAMEIAPGVFSIMET